MQIPANWVAIGCIAYAVGMLFLGQWQIDRRVRAIESKLRDGM